MIGLVVVSHSRALAQAAVALACEMVDADRRPAIAVAAGLDDGSFGTDAAAVAEAIAAVDSPDGVAVLVDLGSAVLSAELALEFLDPEAASRVRVSSAPFVEGLVAAVVSAAGGASLDAVLAEAAAGLAGKQQHLGDGAGGGAGGGGGAPPPGAASGARDAASEGDGEAPVEVAELLVDTPQGLHARPAARLVALVLAADCDVSLSNLRNGSGPVDPGSMAELLTLDARHGDRVRLEASGPGAEELVEAVRRLAAERWGD